ncbi:hypothetical protein [Sorangium sp. So ce341]|uniref:hypothetical protein n=1 Tax=Sorangium sp. So ce341 TaxID=3133302 RepID=UPI003F63E6CC
MGSSALAVLSAARRSSATWVAAVLLGLGAVTLATQSCGTAAVGIDACRQIETARCEAAAACPAWVGSADADERVDACVEFVWDQCLHGIENAGTEDHPAPEPTGSQIKACVDAVGATRKCAADNVASMAECSAAPLVDGADEAISPCDVITRRAHALEACAFVDDPTGAGGGAGEGGGGGSAGGDGEGGGNGGGGGAGADGEGGGGGAGADGEGGGGGAGADGEGGGGGAGADGEGGGGGAGGASDGGGGAGGAPDP